MRSGGGPGQGGRVKRPFGKFRFLMEIDGVTMAHFQSVTGLSHEIEVLTHQEGGVNDRLHKLPGQGSYPNIVLKLGYVNSELVETWHTRFTKNPTQEGRKNGSIVLLNDDGTEVTRWNFRRAWPVKWEGPELDSGAAEIAVESIEVAHEGLTKG